MLATLSMKEDFFSLTEIVTRKIKTFLRFCKIFVIEFSYVPLFLTTYINKLGKLFLCCFFY